MAPKNPIKSESKKHKLQTKVDQSPNKKLKTPTKVKPVKPDSSDSEDDEPVKNSISFDSDHEDSIEIDKEVLMSLSQPREHIYTSSENEEEAKPIVPVNREADVDDVYFEGWSKAEVGELIQKMYSALPANDTLKYTSRAEKIDWEKVKVASHSAEESKLKWKTIEKKLRGYRILKELLDDAKVWMDQPWSDFYRGGKKKKLRHPEMPKKPLTSYMIFYLSKKKKIAEENPGLSMTQLSKLIAEQFNNLSAKKKAKYNKKALQVREEYNEKLSKFYSEHPAEELKLVKQRRKKPSSSKPVPPVKFYIEHQLTAYEDDKDVDITKLRQEFKELWKSLSNKKKIPFIQRAYEAESKYLNDLKSQAALDPTIDPGKYKSVLTKDELNIYKKYEGKPDKPPTSAYGLFSKMKLKDRDLKLQFPTPKERMKEIAKMWKLVPQIDKDSYGERVKQMLDNYKLEYASYLESLPEDKREEELLNTAPKRKTTDAPKTIKTIPKKPLSENDILSREPIQPPNDSYFLFLNEYQKQGLTEPKIKKAWSMLNDKIKEKYENRLEELKQKYIVDYKLFLSQLSPEELKIYSMNKKKTAVPKESSSSSDEDVKKESDDDSSDNEIEIQPKKESSDDDDDDDDEVDNFSDAF